MSNVPEALTALDAKPIGPYRLRLADPGPASKSGWFCFRLLLTNRDTVFRPALIEANYSAGGRGVSPWIEVTEYNPRVTATRGTPPEVDLNREKLERELFGHLADLIPPGGHLMLVCESPAHEATYRLLMRRVPPVLTPLGYLLFASGFRSVRFFYLAEGGWEGQQKVWAEKAINAETEQRWRETLARDLLRFLIEPDNASYAVPCAPNVLQVLQELKPAGPLGPLVAAVLHECGPPASTEPKTLFECARRISARHRDLWP